ncbi:unnamed protein product [Ceratitis capitata]|uniref:(Mediterranean fruit fly) hypothetical protein n=1 Tax=Ceratitis capitata TaxID=7213 RepID=A0A811V9H1_CERCA|nr:unnamed protein product [Ceratitis capitata]
MPRPPTFIFSSFDLCRLSGQRMEEVRMLGHGGVTSNCDVPKYQIDVPANAIECVALYSKEGWVNIATLAIELQKMRGEEQGLMISALSS